MKQVEFDPEADAVYVRLRERQGLVESERIDEQRIVHYDEAGQVVGIEFLFVSRGITTDGLPREDEVRALLRSMKELAVA